MNTRTSALPPTIDDTMIWDIWLAQFRLPIVNVALEVGVIRALSDKVLTHEELAPSSGSTRACCRCGSPRSAPTGS